MELILFYVDQQKKKFEIVSSVYLPYSKSLRLGIEKLINESFCTLENLKLIENKITNLICKIS